MPLIRRHSSCFLPESTSIDDSLSKGVLTNIVLFYYLGSLLLPIAICNGNRNWCIVNGHKGPPRILGYSTMYPGGKSRILQLEPACSRVLDLIFERIDTVVFLIDEMRLLHVFTKQYRPDN